MKRIHQALIRKKKYLILLTFQENCDDRSINENHQQSSPSPSLLPLLLLGKKEKNTSTITKSKFISPHA